MTETNTLPATQKTEVKRINDIDRIDRRDFNVGSSLGGIAFTNMAEVVNFASLMSASDIAIPKHLRSNPGACCAIIIQAIEWKMSPFAVAGKSYVVNDRIGYESQLIHAVIEQRAPLTGRLKNRFTGEGGKRRCIISASVKGEKEPLEFQSAEFDQIQPKNSPLWKTKPDLQLYYNASRDWARMYFPDVILGVYAEDEIDDTRPSQADEKLPGESKAAMMVRKAKERKQEPAPAPEPAPEQQPAPTDPPDAHEQAQDELEAEAPLETGSDRQNAPDDRALVLTAIKGDWASAKSVLVAQAEQHGLEPQEAASRIDKHVKVYGNKKTGLLEPARVRLLDAIVAGKLTDAGVIGE